MPAATPLNVAGLGKPAIGAAEQDRQRILPAGDDNEVDMIRHEAVGEDANVGVGQIFLYQS
jgi:hypothetical protein